MTVTIVASETAYTIEGYCSPENELQHNGSRGSSGKALRLPSEIEDFLRQRMAVCLPRIGAMGRHHSRSARVVVPMQRKPIGGEGLQTLALGEVANR
jgi:hypothetical protein